MSLQKDNMLEILHDVVQKHPASELPQLQREILLYRTRCKCTFITKSCRPNLLFFSCCMK